MNKLLKKLEDGDLRSDGRSGEVAEEVLRRPELFDELLEGLEASDNLIRGRTCNALEVISRVKSELLKETIPQLIALGRKDKTPFVKWHLTLCPQYPIRLFPQLIEPMNFI